MMQTSNPYQSYTYAYPHKTAYRTFDPAIPLTDLWAGEQQDSLFLYMHIPFCEMRCGFCNLFTTVNPAESLERAYVDTLLRHAEATRYALPNASFARIAIGGGTPTYLGEDDLNLLFDIAEIGFNIPLQQTPISVETS